jgi:hypothetical protein
MRQGDRGTCGQRRTQVLTRADPELADHPAQVPLNGPRAQGQLAADLGIRLPVRRPQRDSGVTTTPAVSSGSGSAPLFDAMPLLEVVEHGGDLVRQGLALDQDQDSSCVQRLHICGGGRPVKSGGDEDPVELAV